MTSESLLQSNVVDVSSKITPHIVGETQEEDLDISKVMWYVKVGKKPKLAQIWGIKSKNMRKHLPKIDLFEFRQ